MKRNQRSVLRQAVQEVKYFLLGVGFVVVLTSIGQAQALYIAKKGGLPPGLEKRAAEVSKVPGTSTESLPGQSRSNRGENPPGGGYGRGGRPAEQKSSLPGTSTEVNRVRENKLMREKEVSGRALATGRELGLRNKWESKVSELKKKLASKKLKVKLVKKEVGNFVKEIAKVCAKGGTTLNCQAVSLGSLKDALKNKDQTVETLLTALENALKEVLQSSSPLGSPSETSGTSGSAQQESPTVAPTQETGTSTSTTSETPQTTTPTESAGTSTPTQ